MKCVSRVRVFKSAPETFSLTDAWDLASDELSTHGSACLALFAKREPPLFELATSVAWSSQAILEFQDLQMIPLPRVGRFFNLPFMFCEGLSALREPVITGVNGQVHASLAVLRSALELFYFHYWWKRRLFFEPSYEPFYDWLLTGKGDPILQHRCQGSLCLCTAARGGPG